MIAYSADINFACSQCGQKIVVEKSGAGLSINCPVCEGEVTVPHVSATRRPGLRSNREKLANAPEPLADADFDGTRERFFGGEANHDHAEHKLETAGREIERLRGLLKKAAEEAERLRSSATHAQVEIKSFHSDRQHLKNDLCQVKQRAQGAEAQLAELAVSLAAADQENTALREQFENDLAVSRERLAATETQLEVRERELSAVQARSVDLVEALAGLETEVATLRAETAGLRGELECAQQLLHEVAENEERRTVAQRELETRLEAATSENQRLIEAQDQFLTQAEALRRDLQQTDSGRELLDLRSRVESLTADHSTLTGALAKKSTEAEELAAADEKLRAELQETRRLRGEAERLAAANSEAQLKKDNEVLRGIIARQNVDLGVHHVEVRRLRRARLGLRIVYAFFAIGLLGLAFFALCIFTNQDFKAIFSQIFR